ncbi:MAG: glutamate formimidoyltransferase [Acidimicrobiales bacterium]
MPRTGMLAECVLNISEGRQISVIDEAVAAGADMVLDVHSDVVHNRTVLTLGGPLSSVEEAAHRVVGVAVARIDLRRHEGVHPRFGAADVVPFVAPDSDWGRPPPKAVVAARDRFAQWAGDHLELPCFLYGPERPLPDVRRSAFGTLRPDTGPPRPHLTAGACAVGARPVLIAYNLWIGDRGETPGEAAALPVARALAAGLRGADLRALGLAVEGGAQVSVNITGPAAMPIAALYDTVATGAQARGCWVERAELVGLVPAAVLHEAPRHRWTELDLGEDRTIEGRMAAKGYEVTTDRR